MSEAQQSRVLLARQAILDEAARLHGYELLFRGAFTNGESATSEVLLNAFAELEIEDVVGAGVAFVNFPRRLLMTQPPFDPRRLVIEVLEDVEVDDCLVERLGTLRRQGYTIALDDFVLGPANHRLLAQAAIVKLDVLATAPDALERDAARLRAEGLTLLAEKVEDQETFRHCQSLGFTLFQGFFFAKPEVLTGRSLPASKLAVLQLLAELYAQDADFDQLQTTIARDAALSFKLLRFMNSAAFSLRVPVDSIAGAMTLLGMDQVRQWASMLAMTSMSDKPHALTMLTAARAATCAALCERAGRPELASPAFTAGLFSTMDAFFDRPLGEVLASLPLEDGIKGALLDRRGPLGGLLTLVCARERGETDVPVPEGLDLPGEAIDAAYWDGQHFASRLLAP